MTISEILATLLIGAIAGWLAGKVVNGRGQGVLMNVVIGILGAAIASWLLPAAGLTVGGAGSLLGSIVYATLGAVLLLIVIGLFRRR